MGGTAIRLFLAGCVLLGGPSARAGDRYLATGTVRVRALAMGGAYTAVRDDFAAGLYNPGAFIVSREAGERRLHVYLNPVAAPVAFYDFGDRDNLWRRDGELTTDEALESLAMVVKGVTWSTAALDLGVGLWEEGFAGRVRDGGRFLTVEGLTRRVFHSVYANVKVAPTVSLGLTGTLYRMRDGGETVTSGGYTFGVLLAPNPGLDVGIAFSQMPEEARDARMPLEDIEHGSATAGLAYHPDDRTMFSIDLRAVNKEDLPTSREIHTGIERRVGDRIALRAGYFRKKETKNDVVSLGIGVLPFWPRTPKYRHASRQDILSYTLVLEEDGFKRRWHILSLMYRL